MKVEIIEKDSVYGLECAVNHFLNSDYSKRYRKIINVNYSSFSTRFSGESYSAMIIYEDL